MLRAAAPAPEKIPQLVQDLRSFNTVATLLHVAAHPDDENTQLITYFARGRGYRTAYLSLTRGDGGQNEIGPEFDEKLGVARTHELLAARKIDGGRQFFTRAIDFGYSKTPEETLAFWDRREVLGDVVRIIRQFRPDVIATRFPIPPGSGGHGHHTASGILAVEAFKIAGDPKAYPEQLAQGLAPWQPKRVVWNGFPAGRGGGATLTGPTVRLDIGGADPVTGEGFGAIAGRSRAQHITQGFANFGGRGSGAGPNEQSFIHLGGDVAETDLFDGVDTTWARYAGGAEIGAAASEIIAAFKPDDPAASVPALLAVRALLAKLPADPVVEDKREQLDGIIRRCLGLEVWSRVARPTVVPGESVLVAAHARIAAKIPVRWLALKSRGGSLDVSAALSPDASQTRRMTFDVPADTPITHPYWLREPGSAGISRVDDPKLIGQPENPPALPIEYIFEVGGQVFTVADELRFTDEAAPKDSVDPHPRVAVVTPVTIAPGSGVAVFQPGETRRVTLQVRARRAGVEGAVRLDAPREWAISPATQGFKLGSVGEARQVSFDVTAPAQAASTTLLARATVNGKDYTAQSSEIRYKHLPVQLLQPDARIRAAAFTYEKRGRQIGYIAGAGDDVANAIEQLGYAVTLLQDADLAPEKLQRFDAVVLGVRAFNEREGFAVHLPKLWSYVEAGGTLLAQYNRPSNALPPLGPYPISIQGPAPQLRVTDEKAPVTFTAPAHPAVNVPNKITEADFTGWVQERGAYFPSSWDKERYTTLFAMSDPGEAPLHSSVLIAQHGRGHYVYTGLAFFRQLPAGVPGAYRLFANLVSLGQ